MRVGKANWWLWVFHHADSAVLIEQRAATGLPPAYLPKDEGEDP